MLTLLKRLVGKDDRLEKAEAELDVKYERLDKFNKDLEVLCEKLDSASKTAESDHAELKKTHEGLKRTTSTPYLHAVRLGPSNENTIPTGFRSKLPSGT